MTSTGVNREVPFSHGKITCFLFWQEIEEHKHSGKLLNQCHQRGWVESHNSKAWAQHHKVHLHTNVSDYWAWITLAQLKLSDLLCNIKYSSMHTKRLIRDIFIHTALVITPLFFLMKVLLMACSWIMSLYTFSVYYAFSNLGVIQLWRHK